jgi:hypothetical protein
MFTVKQSIRKELKKIINLAKNNDPNYKQTDTYIPWLNSITERVDKDIKKMEERLGVEFDEDYLNSDEPDSPFANLYSKDTLKIIRQQLRTVRKHYVIITADKAQQRFVIICKYLYTKMIVDSLDKEAFRYIPDFDSSTWTKQRDGTSHLIL